MCVMRGEGQTADAVFHCAVLPTALSTDPSAKRGGERLISLRGPEGFVHYHNKQLWCLQRRGDTSAHVQMHTAVSSHAEVLWLILKHESNYCVGTLKLIHFLGIFLQDYKSNIFATASPAHVRGSLKKKKSFQPAVSLSLGTTREPCIAH